MKASRQLPRFLTSFSYWGLGVKVPSSKAGLEYCHAVPLGKRAEDILGASLLGEWIGRSLLKIDVLISLNQLVSS